MADNTTLFPEDPRPVVTISTGHPQRYTYNVVLQKPPGQTWPNGKPGKLIMSGVFDNQNGPPDSVLIDEDPATLGGCSLQWVVFIKVPGNGNGQFRVTIDVRQDGQIVGGPFTKEGVVNNTEAVFDFSDFEVS